MGFEVSPDEVQASIGGADDQTDAIPMSSSSDSLSMSDETDARATLPTPSDILVSYSTFPGTRWIHGSVLFLINNSLSGVSQSHRWTSHTIFHFLIYFL